MAFPVLWRHGVRHGADLQVRPQATANKAAMMEFKKWFNVKPFLGEG
jgi:hypothetical protein